MFDSIIHGAKSIHSNLGDFLWNLTLLPRTILPGGLTTIYIRCFWFCSGTKCDRCRQRQVVDVTFRDWDHKPMASKSRGGEKHNKGRQAEFERQHSVTLCRFKCLSQYHSDTFVFNQTFEIFYCNVGSWRWWWVWKPDEFKRINSGDSDHPLVQCICNHCAKFPADGMCFFWNKCPDQWSSILFIKAENHNVKTISLRNKAYWIQPQMLILTAAIKSLLRTTPSLDAKSFMTRLTVSTSLSVWLELLWTDVSSLDGVNNGELFLE